MCGHCMHQFVAEGNGNIYPCDFYCDIDFSQFNLNEESEFAGNSHEKITKQVFTKG